MQFLYLHVKTHTLTHILTQSTEVKPLQVSSHSVHQISISHRFTPLTMNPSSEPVSAEIQDLVDNFSDENYYFVVQELSQVYKISFLVFDYPNFLDCYADLFFCS